MEPIRLINKIIFSFIILLILKCTSLEFHNSNDGIGRILASKETVCKDQIEFRHWTALYGTIPIRFLNRNPEDILDGKSFRISERANWLDFIISVVGGFSTSITAKTIVIENCDAVKKELPQEQISPDKKPESDSLLKENSNIQNIPVSESKSEKINNPNGKLIEESKPEIRIKEDSFLKKQSESVPKPANSQDSNSTSKKIQEVNSNEK